MVGIGMLFDVVNFVRLCLLQVEFDVVVVGVGVVGLLVVLYVG